MCVGVWRTAADKSIRAIILPHDTPPLNQDIISILEEDGKFGKPPPHFNINQYLYSLKKNFE